MNLPLPAARRNWPGRLVNLAVALIVLAVAAGMFVFSYAGMRALALEAGVSAQLARLYPGLFDALLVIACVAAVVLRDGRWWARYWAWLVIIVVLAGIGATDVAHAVNYTLPHRQTEAAVAAAPLVAVLLAFSLLLTMLRQSRSQAPSHPPTQPIQAIPAIPPAPIDHVPPLPQPAAAIALPPATDDIAISTEPTETSIEEPQPPSEETEQSIEEPQPPSEETEQSIEDTQPPSEETQPPSEETGASFEGEQPAAAVRPVDEYAPPFATAPFATVPRLNRVRATPTPPGDDEDDDN